MHLLWGSRLGQHDSLRRQLARRTPAALQLLTHLRNNAMEWFHVNTTRNCVFDYVAYHIHRRVLRLRVQGGALMEYGNVPFELARSFPTGITALGFVLQYVNGRYPRYDVSNPGEDPDYPAQMVRELPDGTTEVVEVSPLARKAMRASKTINSRGSK